jgi:hypothetical protein
MPVPQIAVEIVINDAGTGRSPRKNPVEPSGGRVALLSGCTSAAASAECVDAESASDAGAVALISFQPDGSVHIEVGSRRSPDARWAVRDIRFHAGDAKIERFRAAGFAAGTLAAEVLRRGTTAADSTPAGRSTDGTGNETAKKEETTGRTEAERAHTNAPEEAAKEDEGQSRSETGTPAPVPSSPAADAESRPEEVTPRESIAPFVWAFDAGLLVGPSSASGGERLGGYARATRGFGGPLICAGASYAVDSAPARGLLLSYVRGFAGVGYAVTFGRVGVEPRVLAAIERLSASVRDPTSAARDDKSRVVGAVSGGVDLTWVVASQIALVIGGSVEARTSITDVAVRGTQLATIAVPDYEASAGIRVQFR